MDKVREIYEQLDKSLDELAAVEENWRSMVYVLTRLQETYEQPGREGMEMIAVWLRGYMEAMDERLRKILNEMDEQMTDRSIHL